MAIVQYELVCATRQKVSVSIVFEKMDTPLKVFNLLYLL